MYISRANFNVFIDLSNVIVSFLKKKKIIFSKRLLFELRQSVSLIKYDALHDLVPFVQFKKRGNTLGGLLLLVKL